MSEVFETRELVSINVQLSSQESEKQEEPKRVVSACLGIEMVGQMWPVVGADCISSAETQHSHE